MYLKSVFTPEEKEGLYCSEFKKDLETEKGRLFAFDNQLKFSQNLINFYLDNQLPERLMVKYPGNTKFKFCFPMLNNKLVSLMIDAPLNYKFSYFLPTNKRLLRNLVQDLLPRFALRRKKKPFSVPIDQWMKGRLKEELKKILNEKDVRNKRRFNWHAIKAIIYSKDKSFYQRNKLWCLFVLEKWLALHNENSTSY